MYKNALSRKNKNGLYLYTAKFLNLKKGTVIFTMMIVNKLALALAIIGALNWGLVGLFSFDLVAWICGGPATIVARIIYVTIALAGIWCISLLFMNDEETEGAHTHA